METSELKNKLFEGLGTASVCWEPMNGTGVFNEALARKTGDDIWAAIEAYAEDRYDSGYYNGVDNGYRSGIANSDCYRSHSDDE